MSKRIVKQDKGTTQTTTKGLEIPVPRRGAFLRDLRKASRPIEAEGTVDSEQHRN